MCHQWWSHLFLIGSLTSIQLLLWFQRKFAERKYLTCLKSCVCFSCCSVYKDDRPGFWLADTLSDSLQPEAIITCMHPLTSFFFNAIFVSIYLPIVPILWAINIIQAHQDPFLVYIFFHKSTSPKVLAWIVTDFENNPVIWTLYEQGHLCFTNILLFCWKYSLKFMLSYYHIAARSYRLCLCSYYFEQPNIIMLKRNKKTNSFYLVYLQLPLSEELAP